MSKTDYCLPLKPVFIETGESTAVILNLMLLAPACFARLVAIHLWTVAIVTGSVTTIITWSARALAYASNIATAWICITRAIVIYKKESFRIHKFTWSLVRCSYFIYQIQKRSSRRCVFFYCKYHIDFL